jgi:hypothetical protein
VSLAFYFFGFKKSQSNRISNEIKIAVLDTPANLEGVKMCEDSPNKRYSKPQRHGTNIVHIINDRVKHLPVCFYYFDVLNENGGFSVFSYFFALRFMDKVKPDVVNMSFSGRNQIKIEQTYVAKLLERGVKVNVAAGNDSLDLDEECSVFPACIDPRITVVGSKGSSFSNYGAVVDVLEDGNSVVGGGYVASGTSQATALHTAKVVIELSKVRSKKK